MRRRRNHPLRRPAVISSEVIGFPSLRLAVVGFPLSMLESPGGTVAGFSVSKGQRNSAVTYMEWLLSATLPGDLLAYPAQAAARGHLRYHTWQPQSLLSLFTTCWASYRIQSIFYTLSYEELPASPSKPGNHLRLLTVNTQGQCIIYLCGPRVDSVDLNVQTNSGEERVNITFDQRR